MPVALLDTNVLFATASARDSYHDRGRGIVGGIDHGTLPSAEIMDYVLAEVLNLTSEKLGPTAANELLDRLIEGTHFEITQATQTDFAAAQGLFRRYPPLSFVDATIAAYMERTDVPYLYSFDDDFDSLEHVTRLETETNPYT